MYVYSGILLGVYLIIAVVITFFVVLNVFKSKKLSNKIIGAVALIMLVLRILLLK